MKIVAALFVMTNGPYFGLCWVDPWDIHRDARRYAGPHPIVAHPPCERWGRYWSGGPSTKVRRKKGDDDGCFVTALVLVERYGGVIEHPEASHAWPAHGMEKPPKKGGWIRTRKGWTCCVEQGHYGHLARKATWLYVVCEKKPPELKWGSSGPKTRLDLGYHSAEERRSKRDGRKTGMVERLSKKQCAETPKAFRNLLLRIARRCHGRI